MAWLGVVLLLAAPAAAKKPKKAKEAPVEPAPAEQAPELGQMPTVQVGSTSGTFIETPCAYAPGDVHRYEAVKTEKSTPPGQAQPVQTAYRFEMTFTVVSHEGAVTVVDLAYSPLEWTTPPADPVHAALLEELGAASAMAPLRLEIDHAERAQRIHNPEELVRLGEAMAKQIKAGLSQRLPDAPPEALAQLSSMVDQLVTNPAVLQQGVLEDVVPTFGFSCGALPAGETTYSAQFPNPLGGPPLSGNGTVTTAAAKDGTYVITDTTALDRVAAEPIIGPMFAKAGMTVPPDVPPMDIRNGMELTLGVDGWPDRWSTFKSVEMAGASKLEQQQVRRMTE